jgi:hypothetical protein
MYATSDNYIRSTFFLFPEFGISIAIISVVIAGLFAASPAFSLRQIIKISKTELVNNKAEVGGTIVWGDAVLFARVRTNPLWHDARRVATYELSTRSTVVRFSVLTKPGLFVRPTVPWEEYVRQVDELFDLVKAKTGLELVDVR